MSEDGLIDYSEFADLFNNCILELARLDAVDVIREDAAATVEKGITLLDECLIPLHIAFDIALEGKEELSTEGWSRFSTRRGGVGHPGHCDRRAVHGDCRLGVEAYAGCVGGVYQLGWVESAVRIL